MDILFLKALNDLFHDAETFRNRFRPLCRVLVEAAEQLDDLPVEVSLGEGAAPYDLDADCVARDFEFLHAGAVLDRLAFEKRTNVQDSFAATHSYLVRVAVVQVVRLVDELAELKRNEPAAIGEVEVFLLGGLLVLVVELAADLDFDVLYLVEVLCSDGESLDGLGGGEALALPRKFLKGIGFLFELT